MTYINLERERAKKMMNTSQLREFLKEYRIENQLMLHIILDYKNMLR